MLKKYLKRRKVRTRPKQRTQQQDESEKEVHGVQFWDRTVKEIREFAANCDDPILLSTVLDAEKQHPEYTDGRAGVFAAIEKRLAELESNE